MGKFELRFDQQSNTRILASINGNVTDKYLFNPFGEELAVSGTTVNSLRFGGQFGYWRDEAERLDVRRRVLRVDQGRWMSRDPIGFWGGDVNLYRYATGYPVTMVDPSGLTLLELGPGGTYISVPGDSDDPPQSKHDKKCELLEEFVQKMLKKYAKECLGIKKFPHYNQFKKAEKIKELIEYAEYIKKFIENKLTYCDLAKLSIEQQIKQLPAPSKCDSGEPGHSKYQSPFSVPSPTPIHIPLPPLIPLPPPIPWYEEFPWWELLE